MNSTAIAIDCFENPPVYYAELTKTLEKRKFSRPVLHYTDEAIIAGLKACNILVINYIYKQSYPQIRYMVASNSGSKMDAEDLFQDALVVIYQKIAAKCLHLTSSFNTFMYAICRNLWLQSLTKRRNNWEFKDNHEMADFPAINDNQERIEDEEKYRLFQQHFLKLNAIDQKVLNLFLAKTSLKEVTRIMGYKSPNYAKFRKYICKEKLKNAIINDPQFKRIFQYDELMTAVNG